MNISRSSAYDDNALGGPEWGGCKDYRSQL